MEQNIYLHFMSFLHIHMTQVAEIFPKVRNDIFYIFNIKGADVMATQEARTSSAMILN